MRIYELSQKYKCTMTNICLAWQFAKNVASAIIGVTKEKYLDDALNAFNIELSKEDIDYLVNCLTEIIEDKLQSLILKPISHGIGSLIHLIIKFEYIIFKQNRIYANHHKTS